jgi:DNA repair protein RadD
MPAPVLRDYQVRFTDAFRAGLRECRCVLGVSPTGSGKGIMLAWLAMTVAANGKRILLLGHREEIRRQISTALTAFGVKHGIIGLGSPETADPVQVAMVLTLANRLDRYAGTFDLNIPDEAHHRIAVGLRRILTAFPNAYIAGFTAVPLRLDGTPMANCFGKLVLGPSTKELIESGWLSPIVTFAPAMQPDLSGLRVRAGDYEQEALAQRMMAGTITGNAVAEYTRLAPQLPGLAFCVSVAHSQSVAAAFCAAGYKAVHIDVDTPRSERQALIEAPHRWSVRPRHHLHDLFGRGRSSRPGIVLMLRPTKSLGLYLQMAGRASRPAPGKGRAILLDHAGNSTEHELYDFPHAWSLEGSLKTTALVRRCPQCGAVLEIRVVEYPECGHRFVRPMAAPAPRVPVTRPGQLERVDQMGRQRPAARRNDTSRQWISPRLGAPCPRDGGLK